MSDEVRTLAVVLLVLPIINTFFVIASVWTYFRRARSPITFAFVVISELIWSVGWIIGAMAGRSLTGLSPLPAQGLALVWVLIAVSLLPAYIWAVLRRFRA